MREIIINGITYNEEIKSYEHNVGNFVYVMVGLGNMVDNTFVFDLPQQYSTYKIQDIPEYVQSITNIVLREAVTDYTDLLTIGSGNVTDQGLWAIIDRIRARDPQ
jgi:hypothetical protein